MCMVESQRGFDSVFVIFVFFNYLREEMPSDLGEFSIVCVLVEAGV